MNIPNDIVDKIEELAKAVASNNVAESISLAEDEGEEEEYIEVDDGEYDDDFEDEDITQDSAVLSGIKNLLDTWEIRDTSSDAGIYYNDLKDLYGEHE